MLIDWYTVVAQLINFIILVWLLKRFLYRPVLSAIDEREKHIAKQINDAEIKMSDAEKELDTYQRKNKEFEHERKSLLNNAKGEADEKREELIKEAKKEFDELRSRFVNLLGSEQQRLTNEIIHRIAAEIFTLARKTLEDLASVNLEEHIIEIFVERLRNPTGEEREQMMAAFKTPPQHITIQSSFELPEKLQIKIKDAVEVLVSDSIQIRFDTSHQQIAGIELITDNYKMAWSVADYLSNLEERVYEVIKDSSLTVNYNME